MKPIKLTPGTLAAAAAVVFVTPDANAQKYSGSPTASNQPATATGENSGSADWLTDFAAAQRQAKAARKSMLLDFTGSDWCPWCMKLDREILATPGFREFADQHLVLVKVDFPIHHPQSAADQAQNAQLATQFQVEGYPTLVVLNPAGQESGTSGHGKCREYSASGDCPSGFVFQSPHLNFHSSELSFHYEMARGFCSGLQR